jgi:protein TonB
MPATPTKKPAEKKKTDKKRPEVAETKPPKQEDPPKPEVAETKPAEPPKQEDPPKPIEKPVVEPPKPEKPKVTPGVSASAVTKLSGEIPKLTSTVGASNGDARVKLCIDESGKVTSAKIVKSTASIASELQSALMSWRYKPYVNKDGETQAVCFLLQLRLVFKRGG